MTTQRNVIIPEDVFASLAAGGGGERAMRLLAHLQQAKHLALLRMVVATAMRVRHPRAPELSRAYDLIARVQLDRPTDVAPLLRHPPVGTWAIQALRDLRTGAMVDHGYLTALSAVAVLLSHLDCEVEVPLRNRSLFLPFLGRIHFHITDPPAIAMVQSSLDGGKIHIGSADIPIPLNPRLDGDRWQAIRRLTVQANATTTSLLLDDLDPYRFPEGRPATRLDTAEFGHWQRMLADAWALLADHHPETIEEITTGVTVLVPLSTGPGYEVSATSRHSFGAIALSQPSHGHLLAATFAHECQHSKLSALLDFIPLIDDPGRGHWYAPWRNDPRPLGALLQGAYAYLGVTGFWRRQRLLGQHEMSKCAHREFAHWRDGTRDVVSTLQASGALTRSGDRFVAGMAKTLDRWREEPVSEAAVQQARIAAHQHRAAWQLRNGRSGQAF